MNQEQKESLKNVAYAAKLLRLQEERARQTGPGGLMHFLRYHWSVLEPGQPFVDGWAMQAVAEHLEAVTFDEINRLLINVSPGFSKSLLTQVYWPAWEWGPMNMPHLRGLSFSYSAHLTERDNDRLRTLITSRPYQELWGDRFKLTSDAKIKISNDKMGWCLASSVRGVATGERASRVRLDDGHNIIEGESERVRGETVRWFKESMSNRLNDMEKSAIVVIMQRVHELDIAGTIIEDAQGMGYEHLCIPMRYEVDGPWSSSTKIGWSDPRKEDGELAWPERFPAKVVDDLERDLGPWAFCTPKESPVLMGDVSLKPISEVKVGDIVMGFTMDTRPRNNDDKFQRRRLVHTKVLAISRSIRPIVKVMLSSGKVVRCTEDHKWYTKRSGLDGHATYLPPKVGRSVFRVCDPVMPELTPEQARDVGWLAGFFDGEGSANAMRKRTKEKTCCLITFCQGCEKNLHICEKLESVLTKLGFRFNYHLRKHENPKWQDSRLYHIVGQSIDVYQKFLHLLNVTKWRDRLIAGAMGSNFIIGKEMIVSIEPDGEEEVFGLETETGNYVVWGLASSNSSQYQQNPAPRGGGIIKRNWFRLWENPQNKFPSFINVVAAVDPAYTEKDENDPSAMSIWGTFRHPETNEFGIMLVHAWRKRLQIHGDTSPRFPGETTKAYERRCGDGWGLVEWIWHCCDAYGVQQLFIEGKASGISVFQEIERRQSLRPWSCDIDTGKGGGDKVARLTAVQPIFSQGLVWAPDRDWADMLIGEISQFPKGKYDDLTDTCSLALRKLREMGLIQHTDEREYDEYVEQNRPQALQPLYPV